jgi:DNA adenine methylase
MRRYIEPFAGSAVLFLRLNPSRAILSDINEDLIDTYRAVRDEPGQIWSLAQDLGTAESDYYRIRAIDPGTLDTQARAARFVYLNRFCFNGVYRTNAQGAFNVSRGKGCLSIPSREVFERFARRLRKVSVRCSDFESTISHAESGDFAYLDPPYAGMGTRDRGEYGPGSFKDFDLERLAHSLLQASARGAKVLLSYAEHPPLLRLLRGWQVHRLSVGRNVAGFTGSWHLANEVLVSNYRW